MDVPVGIKKNSGPILFSAHPNPVKDLLQLSFDSYSEIDEIVLTDIAGRQMKKPLADIDSRAVQLHLEDLESGVYFLEIKSRNGIEIKKIVKE